MEDAACEVVINELYSAWAMLEVNDECEDGGASTCIFTTKLY